MRTLMILAAAAALAVAGTAPAQAQKIDKNGRCHAASGQFAKAEVCGGASRGAGMSASRPARAAAPSPELRSATAAPATRSTRCKDDRGRFAKCGSAGAHPAA